MYPRSGPTPIDEASISLIFRKIPIMVRCIIAGLERGEGFAQLWNFSNFPGKTRPLCMSTQKYSCENAAARRMHSARGLRCPWLRTSRELPVLYYISYGYVFPHTNHHSKKSARVAVFLKKKAGPQRSIFWIIIPVHRANSCYANETKCSSI